MMTDNATTSTPTTDGPPSPWLTTRQAARRGQCSVKVIYRAIRGGHLRATRLTAGNNVIRIHVDWLDTWLDAPATVINPTAPGPSAVLTRRGR